MTEEEKEGNWLTRIPSTDTKCERRTLLKAAGAGGFLHLLGSCSKSPDAAKEKNLYDLLSKFTFTGQEGKGVNVKALQKNLKNQDITLSFGFAKCEKYCPMINKALASLDAQDNRDSLTHIIISVNPEDNKDQDARDAFMRRIRSDGVENNVLILYPKQPEKVAYIAYEAGAIVKLDQPFDHSAEIMLYAPGGKPIAHESGLNFSDETTGQWKHAMQGKGAGR